LASNKLGKLLLTLSGKDLKICQIKERSKELTGEKERISSEHELLASKLHEKTLQYQHAQERQKDAESKLKDEQDKIIDRRKQLVDLGGAKVAKIMEREVEIAARSVQMLEEEVLEAIKIADGLKGEVAESEAKVSELHRAIKDDFPNIDAELESLDKELTKLKAEKGKTFADLEPRLQALYQRVNTRYPANPVSVASKNSCRTCYRALPQQTFNQIMAGYNMIQCPGCSRILVYGEE